MRRVTVYLPANVFHRATLLARLLRITRSELVRRAVVAYLATYRQRLR